MPNAAYLYLCVFVQVASRPGPILAKLAIDTFNWRKIIGKLVMQTALENISVKYLKLADAVGKSGIRKC